MIRNILVGELFLADDVAFVAHNHHDALEIIIDFSRSKKTFELKINLKKLEVMY